MVVEQVEDVSEAVLPDHWLGKLVPGCLIPSEKGRSSVSSQGFQSQASRDVTVIRTWSNQRAATESSTNLSGLIFSSIPFGSPTSVAQSRKNMTALLTEVFSWASKTMRCFLSVYRLPSAC
jgi:hypothetical protein